MFSSDTLDSFLFRIMKDGLTPSLCISVVDHEKVLYKSAMGYRAVLPYEEDADIDTLYDLSGITKVVQTTMLALRLIERDRLSFDTTVGEMLPDAGEYSDVTVLQLLTHTSGFAPELRLSDYVDTPERAIERILKTPKMYETGKGEAYSCFGYIILGRMLEIAARMPLEAASVKYVYEPLGMSHTFTNPYEKGYRNIASTDFDELTGKMIKGIVHDENAKFMGGVSGNAGAFSNLADMSIFMRMLLSNGKLPDGSAFLSEDMIERLHTDYTPGLDNARGLGVILGSRGNPPIVKDFPYFSYGVTGFTGTSIWVVPELDRAVCILTNHIHPKNDEHRLGGRLKELHSLIFC